MLQVSHAVCWRFIIHIILLAFVRYLAGTLRDLNILLGFKARVIVFSCSYQSLNQLIRDSLPNTKSSK